VISRSTRVRLPWGRGEQHCQGGAIAAHRPRWSRLTVPTVAFVIGEGGSGGAIAIAQSLPVADAYENAILLRDHARGLLRDPLARRRRAKTARLRVFKPGASSLPRALRDRRIVASGSGAQTTTMGPSRLLRAPSWSRSMSSTDTPGEESRRPRARVLGLGVFGLSDPRTDPHYSFHPAPGFQRVVSPSNRVEARSSGLERLPRQVENSDFFCPVEIRRQTSVCPRATVVKERRAPRDLVRRYFSFVSSPFPSGCTLPVVERAIVSTSADSRDMAPIGLRKGTRKRARRAADDIIRASQVDKGRFVELTDEDICRASTSTHTFRSTSPISSAIDEIDRSTSGMPYYLCHRKWGGGSVSPTGCS